MAEYSDDLAVPIVDEDGRVTGVMDPAVADFLASTEPDPTQASLDAAFDGITRVRMLGLRHDDRYVLFDVLRLEVTDPAELSELVAALRIQEAEEYGHCMCLGDHHLEMWADDRLVHTLGLHHWSGIRWESVWKGDANLADPRRFEEWLLGQGITDARDQRLELERQGAESARAEENWVRAMPPSLRPLWPDRLGHGPGEMSPAEVDAAEALLQAAVPDPLARVRALYEWFGSGKGPWSGYPSYEGAAEQLLLAYPIEVLLAALDASTDNPAALYGAARLFGGWEFGQTRRADRKRCPEPLRQRMLDAVIWHGNRDNLRRFRSAFDLPDPWSAPI